MINTTLFEICFYVYAAALVASIAVLVNKRPWLARLAFGLFLSGFALHTLALFVRWGEAGEVEVSALEKILGHTLEGWEWFQVWISHPPWSNLYESLVCFGWGVVLVSIVGIRRFNIPILPVFAIALALVVMGAASLLINQEISPLVPALQSKWLHLHVTMATICYPAFGLAAILALFYLLKVGMSTESIGVFIAATNALIILSAGGRALALHGQYRVPVMTSHGGKLLPLTYGAVEASGKLLSKGMEFQLPLSGVGLLFILTIAAFLVAVILFALGASKPEAALKKPFHSAMLAGLIAFTAGMIALIVQSFGPPPEMNDALVREVIQQAHLGPSGQTLVANYELHGDAPFAFSLTGFPFEFLLLVTVWLSTAFYFFLALKRDWITGQLPDADRLDDMSYRTILFAFPFLTLLIITGAVWAYYAWGRYWGWDPKETWSLVTWIVYSIYLHVRLTHGWEGKIPAVIAVVGFGVVIFTYLGVNILLSGLHSYGSGM